MKADFSKDSFHPEKHFHDVLMQQGRVLLDAEWNEQASLNAYRTETGVRDIVGKSGTPFDETNPWGGFQILPANANADVSIGPGHYYVDGILCENENSTLFVNQPDLLGDGLPSSSPPSDGDYIFYLDVWMRHITVLEDPAIREVALGGPDTTTRVKTVWQVKWKSAPGVNCDNALDAQITEPPTGTLIAKSKPAESASDPCGLAESGGYTRLENQLYRAEIHIGGANRASSTFKWSRDNGIVIAKWESQDRANNNRLVVNTIGRDEILSFKEGDWIELIDDRTDLKSAPGILVELMSVEGNTLIIDPATIKDPDNPGATSVSIVGRSNPRIRRWDSAADIKLNSSAWIKLEDGVEVKFGEGTFRTGDYWLIPARTAIADIEWPFILPQLPSGVKHHYALLGILKLTAGIWSVISDCRALFPPLTDLISLYYVSGDGQEAMPGNLLPQSLIAGVSRGQWPLANARVKFTLSAPGVGSISVPADGIVLTNNEGQASCTWTLGGIGTAPSQQVKAELLDASGNHIHLPVIFTANHSLASNVLYDDATCNNWGTDPHNTVAEAIASLCKRNASFRGCTVTVGEGGKFATIEEAFRALEESSEICICLLPGDHFVGLLVNRIVKATIKITGCNARVILSPGEQFMLTANKIIFSRLEFLAKENRMLLLIGAEVDIDHCTFINPHRFKIPFVSIQPLGERDNAICILRFSDNKMLAEENQQGPDPERAQDFIALTLAKGVGGWLSNNIIMLGDIFLQWEMNEASAKRFLSWTKTQYDTFSRKYNARPIRLHFVAHSAFVNFRGNKLLNIQTVFPGVIKILTTYMNDEQRSTIEPSVYQTIQVVENEFYGKEQSDISFNNSMIADNIILSANIFHTSRDQERVALIVGESGIFVGNMGGPGGTTIQTIFHNREQAANMLTLIP